MEAYCVKCRAKREMKNAKKKGRGTSGQCPKCGTNMYTFAKG